MKLQILDQLLTAMAELQGKGFKSGLDAEKTPPVIEPAVEGEPKGLSIQKVEVMGEPKQGFDEKANEAIAGVGAKPDEAGEDPAEEAKESNSEELSEDELEELSKKLSQLGG